MLSETINELRRQRDTITSVIAQLEGLQVYQYPNAAQPKRRGRKSMGAEERRAVSARMRQWWAKRREESA